MKVREVMSSRVRQISSSAMISEAADRMKTLHVGMLPVVENKDIVGTISERDIVVRAVSAGMNPRTTPVKEVMTAGAVCCSAEDDVEGAFRPPPESGHPLCEIDDPEGDPQDDDGQADVLEHHPVPAQVEGDHPQQAAKYGVERRQGPGQVPYDRLRGKRPHAQPLVYAVHPRTRHHDRHHGREGHGADQTQEQGKDVCMSAHHDQEDTAT